MQNLKFNEQNLISVIIPVYNVKPYLKESIESVILLFFPFFLIILIDDGSTDGSGEICDRYAKEDPRIKVVHQKNRGLSAARNAGLNIFQGEMVAFLDSDDVFYKEALAKMYRAMIRTGADIVECDYSVYKKRGRMNINKIQKMNRGILNNRRKHGMVGNQDALRMHTEGLIASYVWNKLYKRNIWNNLRFREGQNFEDFEIILPLLERTKKICLLNDVLIKYRVRKGSITTTLSCTKLRDRFIAYCHYVKFIRAHIPEYFGEAHLRRVRETFYAELLSEYHKQMFYSISDRKKYFSLLRKEILYVKKRLDLKTCRRKVRMMTWLFYNVPHVVSGALYWGFRPFRILMQRVGIR